MPIYEYRCDSCGDSFERYSAGTSGEVGGSACAICGKGQVKKVFSTFASNCCGSGAATAAGSAGCGGGKSPFS